MESTSSVLLIGNVEEDEKNGAYLANLGAFHIRLVDGTIYKLCGP